MIDIRRLGPSTLALMALRDCRVICSYHKDKRYRDLCDLKMATMDIAAPLDRPGQMYRQMADFRITPKGEAALKRELTLRA